MIQGIDLEARRGSIVAVTGPSGSGKSTLLKAIAGVLPARFSSPPPSVAIGFVRQAHPLHLTLSVLEELELFADLFVPGGQDRSSRVDGALADTGLASHRDQIIGTLSGGERRRLDVASELIRDCDVLILDEPTSGLDPGTREAFMLRLREIARTRDIAVILSTHNIDDCQLAQIQYHIIDGAVSDFGPPPLAGIKWPIDHSEPSTASLAPIPGKGTLAVFNQIGTIAYREITLLWRAQAHSHGVAPLLFMLSPLTIPLISFAWPANILQGLNFDRLISFSGVATFTAFFVGGQSASTALFIDRDETLREKQYGLSSGAIVLGKFLFRVVAQALVFMSIAYILLGVELSNSLSPSSFVILSLAMVYGQASALMFATLTNSKEACLQLVTIWAVINLVFSGMFFRSFLVDYSGISWALSGFVSASGAVIPPDSGMHSTSDAIFILSCMISGIVVAAVCFETRHRDTGAGNGR